MLEVLRIDLRAVFLLKFLLDAAEAEPPEIDFNVFFLESWSP